MTPEEGKFNIIQVCTSSAHVSLKFWLVKIREVCIHIFLHIY